MNIERKYFLVLNPDWSKDEGYRVDQKYLIFVKGPYDIGYTLYLPPPDERMPMTKDLVDKGTTILDSMPVQKSNIEYFKEMWTSMKSEFVIVLHEEKYNIYSKKYQARVLLKASFYNEIVQKMINAGVNVLNEYPRDRLF